METLTANKVAAIFVFFTTSFLGVWLPYFIPVRPIVLKFGLLFASGLFMGLAFLHLSFDCVELFSQNYPGWYPLGFLIMPLGFYMTWLADTIAGAIWAKRSSFGRKRPQMKLVDAENGKGAEESPKRLSCCQSDVVLVEGEEKCACSECPCTNSSACSCTSSAPGELADPTAGPSVGGAITALGNHPAEEPGTGASLSLFDVILLLIALCFHAIFEGLAVGLTSTVGEMWNLTISICLNEFFEGAALGTTLRAQDANRHAFNFLLYAVGASIVAPTGIVIGIILDTTITPDAAAWAQGIGNGLAAGVFICIATRHLIAKAMIPCHPNEPIWMPFLKITVSFLGLTTNALTTLKQE